MSYHDDDTCPHLVRASLLEAENARLKAEVERLTIQGGDSEPRFVLLSEYRHLKGLLAFATTKYCRLEAEVERLRKAGDDLCSTMEANGIHDNGDFEMHEKAIAQWNAAKEGKPSV